MCGPGVAARATVRVTELAGSCDPGPGRDDGRQLAAPEPALPPPTGTARTAASTFPTEAPWTGELIGTSAPASWGRGPDLPAGCCHRPGPCRVPLAQEKGPPGCHPRSTGCESRERRTLKPLALAWPLHRPWRIRAGAELGRLSCAEWAAVLGARRGPF